MAEVLEYFVDSGSRPGFPGNHGPGWYLVDYVERTIRPKPLEQGVELAQEEEASLAHSDANREVLQQGGVVDGGTMAIVGDAGEPELITIPEGATVNLNLGQEGAESVPSE